MSTIGYLGGGPSPLSRGGPIPRGPLIADPQSRYHPVRERWIQGAWFQGLYSEKGLRLGDGRGLRVMSPGFWNDASGPDFRSACLRIGRGPLIRGDVEVHVRASDWLRHRHHRDREYRGVILHAVYENDLPVPWVERCDGVKVPILQMMGRLPRGIDGALLPLPDGWEEDGSGSHPGRCHLLMAGSPEDAASLLDAAGDGRLRLKGERFRAAISSHGPDEALYRGIMEAMGYSRFRSGFMIMAEMVPLREMRPLIREGDRRFNSMLAQALLLGGGGLLPLVVGKGGAEGEESERLVRELTRLWESFRWGLSHAAPEGEAPVWGIGGTRPANLPWRRVAAVSHLIARHGRGHIGRVVVERLVQWHMGEARGRGQRGVLRHFRDLFSPVCPDYWSRHYTLGGRPTAAPVALLGDERLITVICNVFLPFALAWRGDDPAVEEAVRDCYAILPRTGGNGIVRRASSLLLGGDRELSDLITGARREQGLHGIYERYCRVREGSCVGCGHYRRLIRGR